MILYPNMYLKNLLEIDEQIIKKNNIKAILLDIDNTIMYYDRKVLNGSKEWADKMKKIGIKLCILSNSNHIEKVERVSKVLEIPYVFFAKKPLKSGFKRAIKVVKEAPENIAMVGDQILTDVVGANRMNMLSILTEPLEERDIWITKVKRPLENYIIKRYLKRGDNKNVFK